MTGFGSDGKALQNEGLASMIAGKLAGAMVTEIDTRPTWIVLMPVLDGALMPGMTAALGSDRPAL